MTKEREMYWHDCEHMGCANRVMYDNEPYCNKHVDDPWRWAYIYSAQEEKFKKLNRLDDEIVEELLKAKNSQGVESRNVFDSDEVFEGSANMKEKKPKW